MEKFYLHLENFSRTTNFGSGKQVGIEEVQGKNLTNARNLLQLLIKMSENVPIRWSWIWSCSCSCFCEQFVIRFLYGHAKLEQWKLYFTPAAEGEIEDVAVTWLAPRKWLEIVSCAMMHIKCQVPKVVDNNSNQGLPPLTNRVIRPEKLTHNIYLFSPPLASFDFWRFPNVPPLCKQNSRMPKTPPSCG